jgi:hypothetical protein
MGIKGLVSANSGRSSDSSRPKVTFDMTIGAWRPRLLIFLVSGPEADAKFSLARLAIIQYRPSDEVSSASVGYQRNASESNQP